MFKLYVILIFSSLLAGHNCTAPVETFVKPLYVHMLCRVQSSFHCLSLYLSRFLSLSLSLSLSVCVSLSISISRSFVIDPSLPLLSLFLFLALTYLVGEDSELQIWCHNAQRTAVIYYVQNVSHIFLWLCVYFDFITYKQSGWTHSENITLPAHLTSIKLPHNRCVQGVILPSIILYYYIIIYFCREHNTTLKGHLQFVSISK